MFNVFLSPQVLPLALVGVCLLSPILGAPTFTIRRSYGAPSPSYGAPAPAHRAPAPAYGAPPQRVNAGYGAPPAPVECGPGLVRKIDGKCVEPLINRNIFLYQAPQVKIRSGPLPDIPDPQIDYNYVFIKSPSSVIGPDPIVVPPAQQKTLVYILSEEPKLQSQPVIEVPSKVSEPEVFFINYKDGENPTLPGGIDLRTALSQSAQNIDFIGGGDSGRGAAGGSYAAEIVSPGYRLPNLIDENDTQNSNSLFVNNDSSQSSYI